MVRSEDEWGVDQEFLDAELGDRRRVWRLVQLAKVLEEEPDASFSDVTRTQAELEGTYRLLGSKAVTADGILAGHYQQTVERAAEQPWVLAVHDTTIFEFSGEKKRRGLGPLRGKGQGFLGHFALVVAPGELRRPLGVLALQTIVREQRRGKPKTASASNESERWQRGVELVESRLKGACPAIHVMDREADSYDLWAGLIEGGHRFVIRMRHDRFLAEATRLRLSDALAEASTIVERTVALSPRRDEKIIFNRRRRPARTGRLARLALSATQVEIARPKRQKVGPEKLLLNVVHVREVETFGDNAPVEWTLVTTESIATAADVERIVDSYRARWVIEEYFKAIKSGCAYEKRQLESIQTLVNALAVFVPIAWRLLLLRTLARDAEEEPANFALTPTQIDVLIATGPKPRPKKLSVRQAMLAVARLGGHIKNNGEPGWIVLGRGYQKLLAREEGWIAALKLRSDQS